MIFDGDTFGWAWSGVGKPADEDDVIDVRNYVGGFKSRGGWLQKLRQKAAQKLQKPVHVLILEKCHLSEIDIAVLHDMIKTGMVHEVSLLDCRYGDDMYSQGEPRGQPRGPGPWDGRLREKSQPTMVDEGLFQSKWARKVLEALVSRPDMDVVRKVHLRGGSFHPLDLGMLVKNTTIEELTIEGICYGMGSADPLLKAVCKEAKLGRLNLRILDLGIDLGAISGDAFKMFADCKKVGDGSGNPHTDQTVQLQHLNLADVNGEPNLPDDPQYLYALGKALPDVKTLGVNGINVTELVQLRNSTWMDLT